MSYNGDRSGTGGLRKVPSLRRRVDSGDSLPRHSRHPSGSRRKISRWRTGDALGLIKKRAKLFLALLALTGLVTITIRYRSGTKSSQGPPRQREYARLVEENDVDLVREEKHSPQEVIGKAVTQNTVKPVELDPRPKVRTYSGDAKEKFLAYLPHSGYHNQRISLENALAVARMLDRTLLVPPVWLGHSIPYISFDKLYDRVLQARKDGLEHCRDIPTWQPIPQECLGGYWDYTVASWDFLVSLDGIAKQQKIVERWDTSYAWLEKELGIKSDKDVAYIKDSVLYEYRLYDDINDTTGLDKFQKRLNIDDLKRQYDGYRLLHFGTLFGSTRFHLKKPENKAALSLARESMVFRNPYLDEVSDTISARLGGKHAYFGLHIRLGDGVFQTNAAKNAEKMFDEFIRKKLGLSEDLLIGLKEESSGLHSDGHAPRRKQEDPAKREINVPSDAEFPNTASATVSIRASSRKGPDPHLTLPPLANITSPADTPLHSSLSCRGPYHTDSRLLSLNTPIYLATDSKIPTTDPSLRLFFDTFPCIFVLGDFSASTSTQVNTEAVEAMRNLQGIKNKEDGVKLAPFFFPMIDAMVAAKGRDMLGTSGSTFSHFATDVLHHVYHGWRIVERG